jgi:LmbE family N-acetylglucosaminyl deacetylase
VLSYKDQATRYRMGEVALAEERPDFVLTHAYEGRHLDHKATRRSLPAYRRQESPLETLPWLKLSGRLIKLRDRE